MAWYTYYNPPKRKGGGRKGGLKSTNQMGKARPLNLLNTAARLILTCLHPHPFCLRLGDCALASSVPASCVHMQKQSQETRRQAMEGKDAECIWRRHEVDKHDRHGKQRNKKESKQANKREDKQARKQKKVVFVRDKCRFGSNFHSFIVLKYGRHTSKKDSCINM